MWSRAVALLIVLASAMPLRAAAAQSPADEGEARRLFDRGASLAAERKYDEAARAFRASYELRPRKEALFAWAQVARLAGDCATAIELYRKFLASPELTPTQIEAAELSINRCETAPSPAPTPEPVAPAVAPLPPPAPPPPPAVTAPTPVVLVEERRSRGAVVLGASLLGGAVIALGASGTFYYLSRDDESRASAAGNWEEYYEPASRARSRQRLALGFLGGGVLLGGCALIEWLATSPDRKPAPSARARTTLTAWIGGGGAGVAIGGHY